MRVATGLAADLPAAAAERDATRAARGGGRAALGSGLLAVTVPAAYGGAEVTVETLTEVFRMLAAGDPSLAQIPHSHFVYVNARAPPGDADSSGSSSRGARRGRFGNAQSEVRHRGTSATSARADAATARAG